MVAPRRAPDDPWWPLALLALLLASWSAIVALALLALLLPLHMGRLMVAAASVPTWLRHDPLVYLVGAVVCCMFLAVDWLSLVAVFAKFWARVPRVTVVHAARLAALCEVSVLSAGCLFKLLVTPPSVLAASAASADSAVSAAAVAVVAAATDAGAGTAVTSAATLSLHFLLECHVVGCVWVAVGVLAAVGGTVDDLCERLGVLPGPLDAWATRLRQCVGQTLFALHVVQLSPTQLRLPQYEALLLRPLARALFVFALAPAVGAGWAAYMNHAALALQWPELLCALGSVSFLLTGSGQQWSDLVGSLLKAAWGAGGVLGAFVLRQIAATSPLGSALTNICNALAGDATPSGSLAEQLAAVTAAAQAALMSRPQISPAGLWLLVTQITLVLVVEFWLARMLAVPARAWLSWLYNQIRDEHFLIGRKLRNHVSHVEASVEGVPGASIASATL